MSVENFALLVGIVVVAGLTIGLMIRHIVAEFRLGEPPVQIDRFAYLQGKPSKAQCARCGSPARCVNYFKKEDHLWTEWHCLRCCP